MKQDIILVQAHTKQSLKVREVLRLAGMNVTQFENINDIKTAMTLRTPAFLLLDIDIEGGRAFLREVSKSVLNPPPYILAAASFSSVSEYVAILALGADAYINNKPISADEILTVINAVLRRERKIARLHIGRLLPCINYKDLSIDPLRRTVQMRREAIELTEKEFNILHLLAYHSGNVLTREEIYEAVWKRACGSSAASVSRHVFSIRRKLGLAPKDKDYIQTVFGVGYRFTRVE